MWAWTWAYDVVLSLNFSAKPDTKESYATETFKSASVSFDRFSFNNQNN